MEDMDEYIRCLGVIAETNHITPVEGKSMEEMYPSLVLKEEEPADEDEPKTDSPVESSS